jgi:hypothetical protein
MILLDFFTVGFGGFFAGVFVMVGPPGWAADAGAVGATIVRATPSTTTRTTDLSMPTHSSSQAAEHIRRSSPPRRP